MKRRTKKDTYLKELRDKELFEAYQEALRTHTFENQREAVEFARKSQAPRFYISPRECVRGLWRIFRGVRISRNDLGFKRLIKIYEKYLEYVGEYGHTKSKIQICELIVDTPAPEFYIGHEYASKIIWREMKKRNDEIAARRRV